MRAQIAHAVEQHERDDQVNQDQDGQYEKKKAHRIALSVAGILAKFGTAGASNRT
jgi:hypothetical protein